MPQTLRTFIALELEPSVQNFIRQIQSDLKKTIHGKISWVKPENTHLTLKFLGDTNRDQIAQINETLDQIQPLQKSLMITANQLGFFPPAGSIKVIWLGFDDSSKHIHSLFENIEDQLSILGFPKEIRDFQNHMTLGRIKFAENSRKMKNLIKDYPLIQNKFWIESLTFFESTLSTEGSIYTPIKRIILTK